MLKVEKRFLPHEGFSKKWVQSNLINPILRLIEPVLLEMQ